MCDRYCQNRLCPAEWNRRFYDEYLYHHTAMTNWVQQLNSAASFSCYSPYQHSYSRFIQPQLNSNTSPYQRNNSHYPEHHEPHLRYNHSTQVHSYPSGSCEDHPDIPHEVSHHKLSRREEFDESSSEEENVEAERDDIIGSDDEICFNVDSIAILRQEKDSSSEKSEKNENENSFENTSDDFELLDSVPNVEFEYVHLDKFGRIENGLVGAPDTANEIEKEREKKICLYGEKAATIGGLETAVIVDFNRHCDLYQPTLWPVLPLRL